MGKTGALGSFEEMVLLAVVQQGDDAYAVTIRREIAERSGSEVTMGSVYATLDRLETKGLVSSRTDAEPDGRRGRPRRYYRVTPAGATGLAETRRIRETMWSGIDPASLDGVEPA